MSDGPLGLPAHAECITDRDDPRIAVFQNIKERDLVGREGVFIAEGATVLSVLLQRSRLEILAILIEEGRAMRMPILQEPRAAPLYVAPQPILDEIAGFNLHRGILAAGRIPAAAPLDEIVAPPGPLRLPVLLGLSNHDNVGSIYRNAAAFEARAVVIDAQTADPFYRKAIRVGVGAPLIVPTVRGDPAATFDTLRAAGVTVYALTPSAARTLGETQLADRAAFVLGTEGPGLSPQVLESAEPLAIAIHSQWDSLNVATASAIIMHQHYQSFKGLAGA